MMLTDVNWKKTNMKICLALVLCFVGQVSQASKLLKLDEVEIHTKSCRDESRDESTESRDLECFYYDAGKENWMPARSGFINRHFDGIVTRMGMIMNRENGLYHVLVYKSAPQGGRNLRTILIKVEGDFLNKKTQAVSLETPRFDEIRRQQRTAIERYNSILSGSSGMRPRAVSQSQCVKGWRTHSNGQQLVSQQSIIRRAPRPRQTRAISQISGAGKALQNSRSKLSLRGKKGGRIKSSVWNANAN